MPSASTSILRMPRHATSRTAAVITQILRGFGAIQAPTLDHSPVVLGSTEPKEGRAGQNIQRDAEGKPIPAQVVNLLVTPEQAEVLSLISNEMRIQLVLRNPLDTKEVATTGAAEANVFTGAATVMPKAQPAPRPRPAGAVTVAAAKPPGRVVIPITVEVIQGAKRSSAKFDAEPASGSEENK